MMVCVAGFDARSACNNRCGSCRYLVPDRRRRQAERLRWAILDRRSRSNLIPDDYRWAGRYGAVAAASEPGSIRYLPWILITLLLSLNLMDSLLTARALALGFAEANPVMESLFSESVPLGMVYKSLIVGLGAMILLRFRHLTLALRGMTFLTGCYGLVVLYHLYFQLLA